VAGQHRPATRARGENLLGVQVVLLAAQPQGGGDAVCGSADREELQLGGDERVGQRAGVAAQLAQQLLHLLASGERGDASGHRAEDGSHDGVPDDPAQQVRPLQPPGERPGRAQGGRRLSRSRPRRQQAGPEVAAFLERVGEGDQQHGDDERENGNDEPVPAERLDLLRPPER
jgi:hypothetical protein